MAIPASRRKHNVFVGNLTYNTTEEQLRDIFGTVGPVTSVRIVVDKDTGRPKGYAFVEYDDPALALSAIRNLDGHDFNTRKVGERRSDKCFGEKYVLMIICDICS
jgi:cleavage stimulation factor subunit 2